MSSKSPAPPTDYTTWTTQALIDRVTHLESQLRAQNQAARHSSPSNPSPPKAKLKPRKAPKQFDPSRYNTRLIALKFAYLGANYNGFEHHANNTTPLPTIEEELWKALKKTRMIFPQPREGQSEDEVCWEGTEYSKCGRTDRGVSAFGQVIGVRVRSSRPKAKKREVVEYSGVDGEYSAGLNGHEESSAEEEHPMWDSIRDELPYIQLLNRVLPPDIRVLAWCPDPPKDFSARFNCKERRYRYFFTNPAFSPLPSTQASRSGGGWLNISAMHEAAKKYEGLHDFRNLCKVDPSKQITNFERRIFHAGIHKVEHGSALQDGRRSPIPELYYFEVRGSAFLWHQVRHLVAVLFLVGQGYEQPSIVDELLDVQKNPTRPVYDMASDAPLVLWDCIFPDPQKLALDDRTNSAAASSHGYNDGLDWIYVGQEAGGRDQSKRTITSVEDGKYGRNGIMDELWALWRKRKMDEVLAWSLMEVVVGQDGDKISSDQAAQNEPEPSARIFDGSGTPRSVGPYIPVLQREKMETPEIVNARYAVRKGINGIHKSVSEASEVDE